MSLVASLRDDGEMRPVLEINGVEVVVSGRSVRLSHGDYDCDCEVSELYMALMDDIRVSSEIIAAGSSGGGHAHASFGVRWQDITSAAKKVVLNQLFMGETDPTRRICVAAYILTIYAMQLYVCMYPIHDTTSFVTPSPKAYAYDSASENKLKLAVIMGISPDFPIVNDDRVQSLHAILRNAMAVQTPIGAMHGIVMGIMDNVCKAITGVEIQSKGLNNVTINVMPLRIVSNTAFAVYKMFALKSFIYPTSNLHWWVVRRWKPSSVIKYTDRNIHVDDSANGLLVTMLGQPALFSLVMGSLAKYSAHVIRLKGIREKFKLISNYVPEDANNGMEDGVFIDTIYGIPLSEGSVLVQTYDKYVYTAASLLEMENTTKRAIIPTTNEPANFDILRKAQQKYISRGVRMTYSFSIDQWIPNIPPKRIVRS